MKKKRGVPAWRCRHELVRRRPGPAPWLCTVCGEHFAPAWRAQQFERAVIAAEANAARAADSADAVIAGQQLAWAEVLRVFGVRKRQHLLDIGHALQAQARRGRVA